MIDKVKISSILLCSLLGSTTSSPADDGPTKKDAPADPGKKTGRSIEEIPAPFVPLQPRTTEEQDRVEALRLYATARALEGKHQLTDALETLEKARSLDPNSVAILRRLSRLNLVIGRVDPAVGFARKILELDPGDSATLELLVSHYLERKNDPVAAETLLKKVAADPKLDHSSAGYLVLQRDLGDLYAEILNKPELAADCYATLIDAVDTKAAVVLPPGEQKRILKNDEAESYVRFGEVFLKVKRFELALRAFRRGLVYNPEHPVLPRLLADALMKTGKLDEAQEVLEKFLQRQPTGSEPYELLADLLRARGKADQIVGRFEAASKADPKNLRLQFALAEQYRLAGQGDKADALLRTLLANQAEPSVYGELAKSLFKGKKFGDLVRVLGEAIQRPGGVEAVKSTLDAVCDSADDANQALDAGLALLTEEPPRLTDPSRKILSYIAGRSKSFAKLVAIDRLALKQANNPQNYRELFFDLFKAGQYDEAASTIEELFEKYEKERNAPTILLLSRARFFAGKVEPALAAARDAQKLEANDRETLEFIAFLLGQEGKDDDAIAVYEDILKRFPLDEEAIKRARSGISTCYTNKGDNARAEQELEVLLQKYPDDIGVNNDLGYLYADQGKNLEKAESMIRKAVDEEPENSAYLDSLGWVLFKRNKPKEALEPLEKAAKGERLDATICEHLGDVLFRLQDYNRAREYWVKAEGFASKPGPSRKRLPEIKKKLVELDKLGPAPKPSNGP